MDVIITLLSLYARIIHVSVCLVIFNPLESENVDD